ncbi:hypothetical protein RHMOL_Rhmol06G0208900 [Rhododendron molle]|uniref:Uncharacterized protein n=1 Tax=Rhododendron molle TaxID=49168 RepID=A0ACC0NG03_RHOML|nr:hypothetical protein RHMOL_Rhmol06G0208900 [Rhododendron molle]
MTLALYLFLVLGCPLLFASPPIGRFLYEPPAHICALFFATGITEFNMTPLPYPISLKLLAVKKLNPNAFFLHDHEFIEIVKRMSAVHHPNIAELRGFGAEDNQGI